MHPVLVRIGPLTVHTYGVLVAAGFLAGLSLAAKLGKKDGMPRERILDIGFYVLLSAIVGSRLFFIALNPGYYFSNPLEALKVWQGGLVFYGGLLFAVPVALWYMKKHRLDIWGTTDIFVPSLALGHAIGRLGCFSAGCCYGKVSEASWAVTFLHPESLARTGIPLHPVQLYESLGEFVNFLILMVLRKHQSYKGQLLLTYLFLYSVLRFTVEFFRGDEARGFILPGISVSQGISVIIGLAAITVIMRKLLIKKKA